MARNDGRPEVADLRSTLRRLERSVARRTRQVARLTVQVALLTDELRPPLERTVDGAADPELTLGLPSFALAGRVHRRMTSTRLYVREGLVEPISHVNRKLAGRRWAATNGVRVPRVLGRWPNPEAIDWDALPDRCVVKADLGSGAINVFPLVRDPSTGEYTDLLLGEPTTREAVTERLRSRHDEHSIYFAEELLVGRGGDPGTVPDDIKVFCFYGEPLYLEVRRGTQARAHATELVRPFAIDGTELVHVRALLESDDADLPAPHDFAAVADAAGRLSAAIRRPLERLDFYETDQGLVFGEVTPNPGRSPAMVPEWDRRLGEAYERAYARLLRDIAAEGALHVDFGEAAGPDGEAETA